MGVEVWSLPRAKMLVAERDNWWIKQRGRVGEEYLWEDDAVALISTSRIFAQDLPSAVSLHENGVRA